jgi:hypothetical protein
MVLSKSAMLKMTEAFLSLFQFGKGALSRRFRINEPLSQFIDKDRKTEIDWLCEELTSILSKAPS